MLNNDKYVARIICFQLYSITFALVYKTRIILKENPWIEEAGFDNTDFIAKQLLTEDQKTDIKAIIDYLRKDEHKHFQEEHYPKRHIFRILKRLKSFCE